MKPRKILFLSGLSFLGFIIFSFLINISRFGRTDIRVTTFIQAHLPRIVDTPFSLLSLLGSFEIAVLILFILLLFRRKLKTFIILFIFGCSYFLEYLGKLFVVHPGPPAKFLRYDIPFSMPTPVTSASYSYPSGHLLRTAFICVILFYIVYIAKKIQPSYKNLLYGSILIIFGLMCVSRIYLGEHWLSDVIGGSFLGASAGTLSLIFF